MWGRVPTSRRPPSSPPWIRPNPPQSVSGHARPASGPRKVRAGARQLPLPDGAFDAAMAARTVLTARHRHDLHRGLRELRRVSRRPQVRQSLFTRDPEHLPDLWPAGRPASAKTVECARGHRGFRM
ncbi:class I SAM-dependent methyltransferase [Streptomyces lydicus]|uniref:class I SAM-dependent methyltransferase n=1 Tax=Streptomyces lydicus TaxID=47763 RepID=UPI00369C5C79